MLMDKDDGMREILIEQAMAARLKAYAPYSGYLVGAALLADSGKVYCGCNIENAAYGPSNCAERTAVFKAVSEGERKFCAIAVVGGRREDACEDSSFAYPCGVCRQVLREFCDDDFLIIAAKGKDKYEILRLGQLLPHSFGATQLMA